MLLILTTFLNNCHTSFATSNDEMRPWSAGVSPAQCGQDARALMDIAMIFEIFHVMLCAVEIDRSAISVGAGLPAQRGQGRAYMKTGQIQPREVYNKRQLWVPPGFAHGFVVLSDSADFLYKTTDYYHPEVERSLLWNDATVGVQWPIQDAPILVAKDVAGASLDKAELF